MANSSKAADRLAALAGQLTPIAHFTPDSPPSNRFAFKVIIITGANSQLGIGRASAHQFARHGAHAIYLCDFASDNLQAHADEIKSIYPEVETHARNFDAADEESVKGVVTEAVEKYGRLDVFFANAGIVGSQVPFWEQDGEDYMNTMRINALGPFLAAKYAVPAMKLTSSSKPVPSGSIILTASVAGLRSNAGTTAYSASKAAVVSMAQSMAFQLTGTNIRVNALCPGLIETGMTAPVFEFARARGTQGKIGQLNPMKRAGVADEIARVALFLGSDDASYVNGQAWAVDGGLSAGHPFVPGKMA